MSTVACPVSTVQLSVIVVSAHYSGFLLLSMPFALNPSSINLPAVNLSVAILSSINQSAAINRPMLTYMLLACPLLTTPSFTATLSSVRFKFVCSCPVPTLFSPFIALLVVNLSAVDLSTINPPSISLFSVNLSTIKVTVVPKLMSSAGK